MIRVFIADDHAIVRKGFCQIILETPGMLLVGEASTGAEVLEQAGSADWDVLVLDLSMPGRTGLEVIHALRDLKPSLPILVLSMHPEDQYAVRLLKNGIAGFISKDTALDTLVLAIRKVVAGGKYVSEALAEQLVVDLVGTGGKTALELLSDREYRVLCMIGEGKTVTKIGEELFISVKTVSTYRARILEKMNLHTTADLIRYAIENNLH